MLVTLLKSQVEGCFWGAQLGSPHAEPAEFWVHQGRPRAPPGRRPDPLGPAAMGLGRGSHETPGVCCGHRAPKAG